MGHGDLIALKSDKGEEKAYEYMDKVRYQGTEYAVLRPVQGWDTVVIMRITKEKGQTVLEGVDAAVLPGVFALFKKRNKGIYFD